MILQNDGIQHAPVSLSRYGQNPYGGNLYRVVFAPSVKHLIGGKWKDGATEYRLRTTYRHLGNEWVLERWLSAEEFCKMTPEQYEVRFRNESGLLTMGPYPTQGVYVLCNDGPIKPEAIPSVGTLIEAIEFGRNNKSHSRDIANRQLLQAAVEHEEKSQDDAMLDSIREKRPAFGNRPTSFAGNVHSTKSKVNLTRPAPFAPGGMKVLKENKANA